MLVPAVPVALTRRRFHIGDLLTVATVKMVSPRGPKGLEALLQAMAADSTLELPALLAHFHDFRDALIAAYPDLDTFETSETPSGELAPLWVRRRAREFGTYHAAPLLPSTHPLRARDGPTPADPDASPDPAAGDEPSNRSARGGAAAHREGD